jgi:hypothetical protein
MDCLFRFAPLAIALTASALSSPAAAATVYAKFYNGGSGYSGSFNGSGTVYDATKGLGTTCPTSSPGCGASDIVATPLGFTGITATASGTTGAKVWDDLAPNFGGLGVGTGSPSDSDLIAGTDILTLAFTSTVKLFGVGTLFASDHSPFGATLTGASTFLLSIDGGSYAPILFSAANTVNLASVLTGTTFAFKENGTGNPGFYVSAVAYESCGPAGSGCAPGPTPIPGTAFLMGTILAGGIGGMQLMRRRRRRSRSAA